MAKPLAECQAVKELLEKKRSQCGIMLAEIETNTRAEFKKIRGTIRRMARMEDESKANYQAAQAQLLKILESATRTLDNEMKDIGDLSDGEEDVAGL